MEEGGGGSVLGEGVEVCGGGVPMMKVVVDWFTCTGKKMVYLYIYKYFKLKCGLSI